MNQNDMKHHTTEKRRNSCLPILITLPFLVIAILIAMGALLIVADPLEKAGAIVVLSGGGEDRIQEAIRLYQNEYADTIILTETGAVLRGYNAEYSKEQRLVLMDAGVSSTSIWITPRHAASTRDEAKDVRTLITNKNVYSLIVVTDPYHTLRARMIWNEVFAGSGVKIIVRPVRNSWYESTTWWLSPEGWKNTLNEYIKISSYLVLRKGE